MLVFSRDRAGFLLERTKMQRIDEWIARQGGKLDRSEAIRRLVQLGLEVAA
jgi:metal-responsive CopG/Arc/MetJ family transcriptional regulator